jgi:hypothetical protein
VVDRQNGDTVRIGQIFEWSQRRVIVLILGTLAMLRLRRNPGPGIAVIQAQITVLDFELALL